MIIILGLVSLYTLALALSLIDDWLRDNEQHLGFKLISLIFNLGLMIYFGVHINDPTAMNVYQGKTEMIYKGYYNNDTFIKTDSVVKFTTRSN